MAEANSDKEISATLSVVTPAFCESKNLEVMHDRLRATLDTANVKWEWLIIDDHSTDDTFEVAMELAKRDPRVQCLRLSRNSGSHVAFIAGLDNAVGQAAVVMAADLQDPPEAIPNLLKSWEQGAQIVWAVRCDGEDGERRSDVSSRIYYWVIRNFVGMRDIPKTGADFFMMDRQAIDAFLQFDERNVSSLMLINWMGFRQEFVNYVKDDRLHGQSGWSVSQKFKLLLDSIISFSYRPIRIMVLIGIIISLAGFLYAIYIILASLIFNNPVAGWSSLMVVVLLIGGVQILTLGVLGEYIWRGTDQTRKRPMYLIENSTFCPHATRGGAEARATRTLSTNS